MIYWAFIILSCVLMRVCCPVCTPALFVSDTVNKLIKMLISFYTALQKICAINLSMVQLQHLPAGVSTLLTIQTLTL